MLDSTSHVITLAGRVPAFKKHRLAAAMTIAGTLLFATASGSAFAAKDSLCKDGTPKPCKPGGGQPPAETAGNNLSFPVIFSDNVGPAGFSQEGPWRFADIASTTECVGETGVEGSVDPDKLCYYGRKVIVINEGGEVGGVAFEPHPEIPAGEYCADEQLDEDCKIWWLQKRPANFWRALSIGHDIQTPLVVSAVDVGDLLESTPALQARIIRVEFNMLQDAREHDDGEFADFIVDEADWSTPGVPAGCTVPDETGESVGCFAALGMSGAVPGTEQSGNEAQGTDFGAPGNPVLLDPSTIRKADPDVNVEGDEIPVHALVYSHCARLVIQKIDGTPTWDYTSGQWAGPGVGAPVVNLAAYSGWSAEITSSGSIVYGYNWNAKTEAVGLYRMTFVLDDSKGDGPLCPYPLGTAFDTNETKLVNFGDIHAPHLIGKGDSAFGGNGTGGLVYIDVPIAAKTGGGGGKKP